jgi:putative MATE family efflux protein
VKSVEVKKSKRNLTEGDIKKQLLTLTWPMLMGMMGVVVFNLVDTYFVGKLGVEELAAMSFSFPVIMLLNSIALGVGVGTSALVSRNVMTAAHKELKLMGSRAMFLGMILVLIVVSVGLLSIRPVFGALGAQGVVLDFVEVYMQIWYLGVPFVVFPMIGNNILRATGDTFTPGMIMFSMAVVNCILDPLMIFGFGPIPAMGMQGAAWATVIARSVSFIFIMVILIRKLDLFTFAVGRANDVFVTWKKVLYIAGPATFSMLIPPVSGGVLTNILAGFGPEAVAAFGVGTRVEMFALMVIMALGSVMMIFIGQNISRKKYDRIETAISISSKFSLAWGVVLFAGFYLFGKSIAGLFSPDQKVVTITLNYFLIMGTSYGFQGLVMLSTTSFNGLNKPIPSTFFTAARTLFLYLPLAWVGARNFGIQGVFWGGVISNLVVGVAAQRYLLNLILKIKIKELKPNAHNPSL